MEASSAILSEVIVKMDEVIGHSIAYCQSGRIYIVPSGWKGEPREVIYWEPWNYTCYRYYPPN